MKRRFPRAAGQWTPGPGTTAVALLFVTILAVLLQPPTAEAHELSLARFELGLAEGPEAAAGTAPAQRERPSYRLLVLLPDTAGLVGPKRLGWPQGCEVDATQEVFHGGRARIEFTFSCDQGLSSDALLSTPWGQDGAVFTTYLGKSGADSTAEPQTLILAGRRSGVDIPLGQGEAQPRSLLATARDYAGLGMFHILEGFDHLAFVLCLCLLVGGRGLLLLVTAFTVGHSASLALAYLGYISIPMRPVEAVIALSVAFMAREAILQPQPVMPRVGIGLRYPAVVMGFGLLHGLGFASELEGLGVSAGERVTGLVTFNLGVEIGQLLFVAFTLFMLHATRLLAWQRQARLAALAGAGILGMYWFTERIVSLF
ncbi:MAG: HupE/UreJ family protein [Gammaproteobacteria bacterium]|nr:HupE/UreJ family protein [Gammaproteobacteria bacterium]